MSVRLYPTPGDFLRDNREFFEKYEVQSQLNRGNAAAHESEPCGPQLLFGRVELSGAPVLLFGNTPPWNLCLNAYPGAPGTDRAAAELGAYIRENGIGIAGVTGRDSLCKSFMSACGGNFRQHDSCDIMLLEKLIEPPPCPGTVRRAVPGDLDTLTQWALAFYREALGDEEDPGEVRERRMGLIKDNRVVVLELPGGEIVSMAQTSRETERGMSISGVFTPPEHRGKGYCQNTVAALCRELLACGKSYVSLFVDKKNPISNRVYRKIGFEVIEDSSGYRLL